MKDKKLKYWNGGGCGNGKYKKGSTYVAAYSMKQAAELLSTAFNCNTTPNRIKEYYSPCWGNSMKGIEVTEPCVYASVRTFSSEKPVRIL